MFDGTLEEVYKQCQRCLNNILSVKPEKNVCCYQELEKCKSGEIDAM